MLLNHTDMICCIATTKCDDKLIMKTQSVFYRLAVMTTHKMILNSFPEALDADLSVQLSLHDIKLICFCKKVL